MMKLTILVGLPGSGKTTWRNAQSAREAEQRPATRVIVLSTDDYIEAEVQRLNAMQAHGLASLTYNSVFFKSIDAAEAQMRAQAATIEYDAHTHVIVDRYNVGMRSRKEWLQLADRLRQVGPVAVTCRVFNHNLAEVLWPRNEARKLTGRNVPDHVIVSMHDTLQKQYPTIAEGYDTIVIQRHI